jgi:ribosomal-protein-alanine N-acetyltransferase
VAKVMLVENFFYLRRMEEKDLPYVYAIESISFPNPWHLSTFKGEIQNHEISYPLVAVHSMEERVIGYIIFWVIRDEVQINNIAINPDFRRKGIGESMLGQVIAAVKKNDATFISLEVRPSNGAAFSLYQKLGFKIIGRRKDYYFNPREDALVLGMDLNQ